MALTDDIVYVISIITRQQIGVFYNSHKSSLTYCSFYQPLQYFITAARDGTVHIYHTGMLCIAFIEIFNIRVFYSCNFIEEFSKRSRMIKFYYIYAFGSTKI